MNTIRNTIQDLSKEDKARRSFIVEKIIGYVASAKLSPFDGTLIYSGNAELSGQSVKRYIDDDHEDITCSTTIPLKNIPQLIAHVCVIYCNGLSLIVATNERRTIQLVWLYENFDTILARGGTAYCKRVENGFAAIIARLPSAIMKSGPSSFGLNQDHIVFHSAGSRDAALILPRDIIDVYGHGHQFQDINEHVLDVENISDEIANAIVSFTGRINTSAPRESRQGDEKDFVEAMNGFSRMDRANCLLILNQLGLMKSRARM